jgi:hypothetical protein
MDRTATALCSAFDYVWERFLARLQGLGDDEYFWEPVEGCWSIRQDAGGRWRIEGTVGDASSPFPPPITTIAWRIAHLAGIALGGFADRWFGSGRLQVQDIECPGAAGDVREFCERNYRAWRDGMASIEEEAWWIPLGASWGPFAQSNGVDLALHVLDEVVHHGAEVGLLRDLYRRRDAFT